jgi:hypothetical protein
LNTWDLPNPVIPSVLVLVKDARTIKQSSLRCGLDYNSWAQPSSPKVPSHTA